MRTLVKSFLSFSLAGVCFTAGNSLSKHTTISAYAIMSLRFIITSTIILIIFRRQVRELFSKRNLHLHLLSILFMFRSVLIMTGFQLTALAKPLALVLTWPILFTILAVIFLGTKLGKIHCFALALASVGMFLILGDPSLLGPGEDLLGYGCILAGSLLTAIEITCNRGAIERDGGLKVLFYATFLGGIITTPTLVSFTHQSNWIGVWSGLFIVSIYVAGTFFYYFGLQTSTPITTAVFSYVEVPIATITALYFYGEPLTFRSVLGIVSILVGVILVSVNQKKRSDKLQSTEITLLNFQRNEVTFNG